jgi:hypothetical protein
MGWGKLGIKIEKCGRRGRVGVYPYHTLGSNWNDEIYVTAEHALYFHMPARIDTRAARAWAAAQNNSTS